MPVSTWKNPEWISICFYWGNTVNHKTPETQREESKLQRKQLSRFTGKVYRAKLSIILTSFCKMCWFRWLRRPSWIILSWNITSARLLKCFFIILFFLLFLLLAHHGVSPSESLWSISIHSSIIFTSMFPGLGGHCVRGGVHLGQTGRKATCT